MLRQVAAIVGGLLAWIVIATVGNRLLRAAWPGYAEVEVAMNFTFAMLLGRLLLGAVSSLCAGLFAAWIAKRDGRTVKVLAGLLLVVFIPVHYTLWERFPAWYHVVFLCSLVAATIAGAKIYSYHAGPSGEHQAHTDGAGRDGAI